MKVTVLSLIDALGHLLNFFAPAIFVGLLAAGLAKVLWRHELRSVRWVPLAAWSAMAGAAALAGGLVWFGHDGKMATYAVMVVVCAATLWWVGFGLRKN